MITFSCPSCDKSLKVKDELAGKRFRCPECGNPLAVPASRRASASAHPGKEAAILPALEPGQSAVLSAAEKPPQVPG